MSDTLAGSIPRLFPLAAQVLGWPPTTFWSATPADLLLALGSGDDSPAPLTRADLDRMLKDQNHG